MKMLPRLQAEEQLREIDVLHIGIAGALDPESVQPVKRRLHERAEGVEIAKVAVKASPAQLAAVGIGMRKAPSEKPVNRA